MAFRLQVTTPEAYDGNGDFDDWSRRLLSYLSLSDMRYKDVGEHYLQTATGPLSREQMSIEYDGDRAPNMDPMKRADYLSSVLFNVLLQLTKGPAYVLTRGTPDDNGFETLRLLRDQFGKTKRQTMISTLMRIVQQRFDETRFVEQLTKWEFDIAEFEKVTADHLPDLLKTTLLIIKTSGSMYRYLCMQINELVTYQ